jgi:hypothetical protein
MPMNVPIMDNPAAAAANRAWLEATLAGGGSVGLGAGTLYVDRGVALGPQHSFATLRGVGMGRTVIRNTGSGDQLVSARTLAAYGGGIGYADGTPKPTGVVIQTTAAANYKPGMPVYCFTWNGYLTPAGQGRAMRTVKSVAAPEVTLDAAPPPAANNLKWVDGMTCNGPLAAGDVTVNLTPAGVSPGDLVYVTDGPSIANEANGEYASVAAAGANHLQLRWPLRRSYSAPAVVARIQAVRGLTVADLTLAAPPNPASESFYGKFLYDCQLLRVGFEGAAMPGIVSSGRVRLDGCESPPGLALNTCTELEVSGGRYGDLPLEEGCCDCTLRGLAVGPTKANGVTASYGCRHIHLADLRLCRVTHSPLGGRFDGSVIERVVIVSPGAAPCYLQGDGVTIRDLTSDGLVVLQRGMRWHVENVRAHACDLGWPRPGGLPSQGVAVNIPPGQRQGNWKVWP